MTKQEIFDKVYTHFVINRNPKSIDPKSPGICKYRTSENNKCAVGILIPDEIYDLRIEGSRVSEWSYDYNSTMKKVVDYINQDQYSITEITNFLGKLQKAHDNTPDTSELPDFNDKDYSRRLGERLRDIAHIEGLSIPFDMQWILDSVYEHFIVDNSAPGYNVQNQHCTYKSPPCAIGIFMDKETLDYVEKNFREGYDLRFIFDKDPEFLGCKTFSDRLFMVQLQKYHDSSCYDNLDDHNIIDRDKFKDSLLNYLTALSDEFDLRCPGEK